MLSEFYRELKAFALAIAAGAALGFSVGYMTAAAGQQVTTLHGTLTHIACEPPPEAL